MKQYKLAYIEWVDSALDIQGWRHLDDIPLTNLTCYSTGFIVLQNKKSLFIVPHISSTDSTDENPQCSGGMEIPIKAISKIKYLKYK